MNEEAKQVQFRPPWLMETTADRERVRIYDCDGNNVGIIFRRAKSHQQDLRNINLIVAAPDMYMALEEFIQWVDRAETPDKSIAIVDENGKSFFLRKARAALAKARGES